MTTLLRIQTPIATRHHWRRQGFRIVYVARGTLRQGGLSVVMEWRL